MKKNRVDDNWNRFSLGAQLGGPDAALATGRDEQRLRDAMRVAQNLTTANPGATGTANPMMRLFGHRSMPWYGNQGVQPAPK